MKAKGAKILTTLMLAVFMNLMFSNTVFIHSHKLAAGGIVTHSHPYVPASHHSHSAKCLDLIAAFNLAALSVESSPSLSVPPVPVSYIILNGNDPVGTMQPYLHNARLRAPPALQI